MKNLKVNILSYICTVIDDGQISRYAISFINIGNNKPYSLSILDLTVSLTYGFFVCLIFKKLKYLPSSYKSKTFIPLKMIRDAVDNNWINTLAYFCQLKQVHQNRTFYRYSIRKLAKAIDCSAATMSHHLKVMQSKGLITIKNDNLTVTGTNKLKAQSKSKLIPVKTDKDKSIQVDYIRFAIIKRNMAYQKVGYEFRNKALKFLKTGNSSGLKAKMLANYVSQRNTALERFRSSEFLLSNKSFGKLINRSQATGRKFQSRINKLRLIKSIKNVLKIDGPKNNLRGFNELTLPAKLFLSYNGDTYLRLPNKIILRKRNI